MSIAEKATKLLVLALDDGTNAEEREAARTQVRRLILKHGLEVKVFDPDEEEEDEDEEETPKRGASISDIVDGAETLIDLLGKLGGKRRGKKAGG